MGNLPDDVTDAIVSEAGGAAKQPTDEQVHAYACEHWRQLLHEVLGFESAEVTGFDDASLEQTEVLLTVRVPVEWTNVS